MELILAYCATTLSVGLFVFLFLQKTVPTAKERWLAGEAEIAAKLHNIFYTQSSPRTLQILKYVGAFATLVIATFSLNSVVFGAFLAVLVYFLPNVILDNIIARRRERLEEQTADVMTALSASIKGGMTIEQSFDEVVETMHPPISEEFALIRERIDAGQPVVAAVRSADQRLDVPRLGLIFQTIVISLERGGRLASLMDRLANSTREIERVEERVKTETSGLRLSARIMVFMPFAICGLLYMIEPNQVLLLFNNVIGNVVLVLAITMNIGAYFIMRKIIDLDV
ncbi:MAG: type II secretion system F family protein [Halioglobus sp.]